MKMVDALRICSESDIKRFWDKVECSDGKCWIWTSCLTKRGYGDFAMTRLGHVLAHRMSYGLTFGDPGDMCVLHKCDNPPCVNPEHLFIGTQADNLADMRSKGRYRSRQLSGAEHPNAIRISDDVYRDILAARQDGETYRSIGMRFGIGRKTISRIIGGTHLKGAGCVSA